MSQLIHLVDLYTRPSPLSGEASRDVITHTLQCIAALGKPQIIKTDNGPSYTGTKFQQFCSQFDIKHVTGVPYNPQRQGIVERGHQTLKKYAWALDWELQMLTPPCRLETGSVHVPFVLNFLSLDNEDGSATGHLWHPKSKYSHALMWLRDSPHGTMERTRSHPYLGTRVCLYL